jgi:hypothetical protein
VCVREREREREREYRPTRFRLDLLSISRASPATGDRREKWETWRGWERE